MPRPGNLFRTALTLCLLLLALAFLLFAGRQASGEETWYVGDNGDFSTIQEAVDSASEGDTIILDNGSYQESVHSDVLVQIQGNSTENCTITGDPARPETPLVSGYLSIAQLTLRPEGYANGEELICAELSYPMGNENRSAMLVEHLLFTNASLGLRVIGETEGELLEGYSVNRTFVRYCNFSELGQGLVLGNKSYLLENRFSDCERAVSISNRSQNIIHGNTFSDSNIVNIHLEGEDSRYNSLIRNMISQEKPKIHTEPGVLLYEKDFLNVRIFDGYGVRITGADVRIENLGGTIYATPHFGGTALQTMAGGLPNSRLMATVKVWQNQSKFFPVDSQISIFYANWTDKKTFALGDSSPVEFNLPESTDLTVDPGFIKLDSFSKKSGKAVIQLFVDNEEFGNAVDLKVEVYVIDVNREKEEHVFTDIIAVQGKRSTELQVNHTFKNGNYQIKVVLNSDGEVYETNTSNNVILGKVFEIELEDEGKPQTFIIYLGLGAFTFLVVVFFSLLFMAYRSSDEVLEKRGKKPPVEHDEAGHPKSRVLVGYDDLGTRISLKRELEQAGYETVVASDTEFRTRMGEEDFDAYIISTRLSDWTPLVARVKGEDKERNIILLKETGKEVEVPGDINVLDFSGSLEDIGKLKFSLGKLLPTGGTGIVFKCMKCQKKLKASRPGPVKCPHCHNVNHVAGDGSVNEKKPASGAGEFKRYFALVDRLMATMDLETKKDFAMGENIQFYEKAAKGTLTSEEEKELVSAIHELLTSKLDKERFMKFKHSGDFEVYITILKRNGITIEEEEPGEEKGATEEKKEAGEETFLPPVAEKEEPTVPEEEKSAEGMGPGSGEMTSYQPSETVQHLMKDTEKVVGPEQDSSAKSGKEEEVTTPEESKGEEKEEPKDEEGEKEKTSD